MNTNIVSYYENRAEEYEKVYAKPERQQDLHLLSTRFQEMFAGKEVLEIACGTGYWTERIAHSAASVYATDINESVINVAKQKIYPNNKVSFGLADIYNLSESRPYQSLFAGFIWSHINLQDLDPFLQKIHRLVKPGGIVVFVDNIFVAGSNHPITRTDAQGNTFQTRKLENGTTHEVLKNFPTDGFLFHTLKNIGLSVDYIPLKYYWILTYIVPANTTQVN